MGNKAIYGRYVKMRDSVWKLILEHNINALPINIMEILSSLDIALMTYADGIELTDNLHGEHIGKILKTNILLNPYAFAVKLFGRYHIFYNEQIYPRFHIKFYLTHELAHILLGHEAEILELYEGKRQEPKFSPRNPAKSMKDVFEYEADHFAVRLLAPSCVLYMLNITNAEDIEYLCMIPFEQAQSRAKRMKHLYQKGKFATSKLEQQIMKQFECFVAEYKRHRY